MAAIDLVPIDKELRSAWHDAVLRASIAKQIKALRESRGWTQAQLGENCGMPTSRISVLENQLEKAFPTVDTLKRIAWAFDVALVIKFESWGRWVAITANGTVAVPFDRECDLISPELMP